MQNINVTLFKENNGEYFIQAVTEFGPEEFSILDHQIIATPTTNGEALKVNINISDQGLLNSLLVHDFSIGTFPNPAPNEISAWEVEISYMKDGIKEGETVKTSQAEGEALPRPFGMPS